MTALLHCPIHFCKMSTHSKVTDAPRRQVVKMKNGGKSLSPLSSESVISRILRLHNDTNSFNSTKKAGRPRKTSLREYRMIQRLSMGDHFDTATGISRQIIADLGKEVSRQTVSRRLSQVRLKASPVPFHQASHQQNK